MFESTGAASGSAALLKVRRMVPEDLTITVETGLTLVSSEPQRQDVGVLRLLGATAGGRRYTPATTIVLQDDDEHTYLIEAYCLNAHKDNPRSGMAFTMGGPARGDVVAVLESAARNPDAEDEYLGIQAAVWALTDNVTRQEMDDIGYGLSESDLELARRIVEDAGIHPGQFRLFASD
jgi:hypothetical protein